jgi:endonuclease YncB( thermonuclease family)
MRSRIYRTYVAVLLIGSMPSSLNAASSNDLMGQASIIDGDTLEIHDTRIRLWGIDAPEHNQLCRGDDSLPYRCGAKAANDLYDYIARRPVVCLPREMDRYGRTVAICSVAGVDLGHWLTSHGLALDWPQYSRGYYADAQSDAKREALGMWSGSFVEPWLFRACLRGGGRPSDCSDDAR